MNLGFDVVVNITNSICDELRAVVRQWLEHRCCGLRQAEQALELTNNIKLKKYIIMAYRKPLIKEVMSIFKIV